MNHSQGTLRTSARSGKARFGRAAPAAAGGGALLLALGAQACGQSSGTPEARAPKLPVTVNVTPAVAGATASAAATAPSAPASITPSTPPPAPPPSPPFTGRRFLVETRALPADINDDSGPAPCDFDRSYRGSVDKTPLTIIIHSSGQAIQGLSHYDKEGPATAVSGSRSGSTDFTFAENPGGTFTGHCDDKGVLRGEFVLGKSKSKLELRPQPKAWPGVYHVERKVSMLPNNPICAKKAKQNEVVTTTPPGEDFPFIDCLPLNPQKRKELLAEIPDLGCSVTDHGYRLFGLASAAAEQTANLQLRSTSFDEMVRDNKLCNGHAHSAAYQSLVALHPAFATFSNFNSRDGGGAHPLNGGNGSVNIDLATGAALKITQIITKLDALRNLAGRCVPIYRRVSARGSFILPDKLEPATCATEANTLGRYLWGCTKDDVAEPLWSLVPEGMVIGVWANAHATAAEEGQGPILPWGVLLREGLLRADSPMKSLWAGITAAAADALPCSSSYEGKTFRSWQEQPASP